jgi:2-polyprenyl-3-methyl-5-hydroxy-6-metoxy-1,4-benzoquinol methylase
LGDIKEVKSMTIETIGTPKNAKCNKTHLDIEKATERGILHRDYLSHMLRWTHTMRHAKNGHNILDVGCANGMLAQVLYVNRLDTNYVGVDIRMTELEKADKRELKKKPRLICMDITKDKIPVDDNWADIVTCFEVAEHIPPESLDFLLENINRCVKPDGIVLLSTPNFNGKDIAANHIHEYREKELQEHLEKFFEVKKKFGTFASQTDIAEVLKPEELKIWEKLKEYYDVNMFSVLFAPMYPSHSRNILWVLKKKSGYQKTVVKDYKDVKEKSCDLWEI